MTSRKTSRSWKGRSRSWSRLEAKMEGLGLVSVSGKIGKVSPRSCLDQTFKRLGLVSVSKEKVSFTSLGKGITFSGCPYASKPISLERPKSSHFYKLDVSNIPYPQLSHFSFLSDAYEAVRSSRSFFRPVRYFLPRYLMNALNNFSKTDRKYSLASTDDLIRFWRSKVKVTEGCHSGEGIHVF